MKLVSKALAVIIIFSLICLLPAGCTKKDSTDKQAEETQVIEKGKLLITVSDKEYKEPIADAKIVIAGVEGFYKTDGKGQSPEIDLEINKDVFKKYGAELFKKAPSGMLTIFVTKDGYKDYIVFNRPVYPGYSANNVNIQMSKPEEGHSETYTLDIQYPDGIWINELVEHCRGIESEKNGAGENKIAVTVKDEKSNAIEGASVFIPELGIKVLSDKNGLSVLKPAAVTDIADLYPSMQQHQGYTVVVDKDGYMPAVVFDVTLGENKEGSATIVLKSAKAKGAEEYTATSQPYDKDWLSQVIASFHEQEE
ncbi:MAG TPA: hypothetical protein DD429_11905 [Clostridiaceae bacterium]|nr:hypothetical protein [Clostridiaceae bacterium]